MWEVFAQPAPLRHAADSWTRFPWSRITDLRSASTPMPASCGRKCRMVLQTASCRDPRSIRPLACASSSEEKLGQYNASQLRAGPGRLLLIKANHRCRPDLGAASQTASRDLPYAGD